MRNKGRIAAGADADLTLFDAARVAGSRDVLKGGPVFGRDPVM